MYNEEFNLFPGFTQDPSGVNCFFVGFRVVAANASSHKFRVFLGCQSPDSSAGLTKRDCRRFVAESMGAGAHTWRIMGISN